MNGRLLRWHRQCALYWRIAVDPSFAREFVFARDGGECADCGDTDPHVAGAWEVDHGVALADAPRELAFWLPENLFTRCLSCHRVKTVAENARRRERNAP